MRTILLSLTALVISGGVASADRVHVNTQHRGSPRVERVERRGPDRGYVRERYARRPIYVQRPRIHERYFDFHYRPQVIVENYAPMDGYTWIAGAWQWNGGEWVWAPGHYEPIADAGYDYE